jgi:hypothetical protein
VSRAASAHDAGQIARGVVAQPPDAPRRPGPVAFGELGQPVIGLLQQQRAAGGGAAMPDAIGLEQDDADAGLGEAQRGDRTGDPAADDRDVGSEAPTEPGMQRRLPREPGRQPDGGTGPERRSRWSHGWQ